MSEYTIQGGNEELIAIAKKHHNDIILLDFMAVWCHPCQKLTPELHHLVKDINARANRRCNLILCKIDVDDQEDLAALYNVNSMPTLVWISNMKQIHRVEGYKPDQIREFCMQKIIN